MSPSKSYTKTRTEVEPTSVLLSIKQVSGYLSVSVRTVHYLLENGRLTPIYIHGRKGARSIVRIARSDLNSYIESCKVG